jgi:hypothetical protein
MAIYGLPSYVTRMNLAGYNRPNAPLANTPLSMGVNYGVRSPVIPRANTPMAMGVNYRPRTITTTRPVTTTRPSAGRTPTLEDLYKQIMGTIETPAQAEARVKREIDEQMAAQQKLLLETSARERADALAAMNAMSQAGAAAAAMSKGLIGAVGGEYNQAAQEISGLAGGLTGAFNAATAADVKAANKALGKLGGPALTEGGLTGYGGGLQAGVESYRGGTIPSQLFTSEGEAATFGLAGETAAQNLRMTQEATAAYQSTVHDIIENEQKAALALAAQRPELMHQYLQEANDARIKAITLASGLLTAQQAGVTKPIVRQFGNTYRQYDPKTGRWITIATKPATPRNLQTFKGSDGRTYILHPNGTATLAAGQAGPKTPAGVNLTFKTFIGPDGKPHLWSINPRTGVKIRDLGVTTGKGPATPPAKKPPTADVIKSGWEDIRGHQLLVRAQQKLAAYNAKKVAEGAERSKGVPWQNDPITLDELSQAPPEVKAAMGLTGAEASAAGDPHTLQEIYLGLIHSGIKPRKAWMMIRQYYPKFGAGYFR